MLLAPNFRSAVHIILNRQSVIVISDILQEAINILYTNAHADWLWLEMARHYV